MAHIEIDKIHNLGTTEAIARFGFVQEQLERKYGVHFIWNGSRAEIWSLGVKGYAAVNDVSLRVSLKLTLLLRPFAGHLKRLIEHSMDETIEGKLSRV